MENQEKPFEDQTPQELETGGLEMATQIAELLNDKYEIHIPLKIGAVLELVRILLKEWALISAMQSKMPGEDVSKEKSLMFLEMAKISFSSFFGVARKAFEENCEKSLTQLLSEMSTTIKEALPESGDEVDELTSKLKKSLRKEGCDI